MTINKFESDNEHMTEKILQKVSSNGRVVIPKDWRKKLAIDDSSEVVMQLDEDKKIIITKKTHPLEIEDDLFDGADPFTDEELAEAKRSLFPNA